MHKIFGIKRDTVYLDRMGAYLIPVSEGRIAVVETPKGFFLLGGGIEKGETDEETILRECMEEAGCEAVVERLLFSRKLYHPSRKRAFPPYTGLLFGENQSAKPASFGKGSCTQVDSLFQFKRTDVFADAELGTGYGLQRKGVLIKN